MRIAILATAFSAIGHSVVFGVRDPEALEEMVKVWLVLTVRHGRTVGFANSNG